MDLLKFEMNFQIKIQNVSLKIKFGWQASKTLDIIAKNTEYKTPLTQVFSFWQGQACANFIVSLGAKKIDSHSLSKVFNVYYR